MKNILNTHRELRRIETLVENRTVYGAEYAELNIYETFQKAEGIYLEFNYPILASMISGKKIMHLEDSDCFDFLPGESVVLPSNKKMVIDFPESSFSTPTQCLALGIQNDKIEETLNSFRSLAEIIGDEQLPLQLNAKICHLDDNPNIALLIQRLTNTFIQNNSAKDVLIDVMLKELIIRLLQTNAKISLVTESSSLFNNNRLAFIVKYMRENFRENITVDSLAKKACMSTSNFYKKFKNTFGETPVEHLNALRIKFAKKMIRNSNKQIVEIAELSGFNSSSYFNRIFKKTVGLTPNQYRISLPSSRFDIA